jgi:branched-chain amino acid transport system substrate-binding protein
MRSARRLISSVALVGAAVALALAGCSSPQEAANGPAGDDTPYKVGIVYSETGALASYGQQYKEGFEAGLKYATKGTGKVGNHPVDVTWTDDAGDPTKAVPAVTNLIGQGVKVIAGSTSSGVAVQVAPLAKDNKVLFISGPAASDAVTGVNKYTFRSGRQSLQDVLTASTFIGDLTGKKVLVFAQDSAFGQANVAAVTTVLGGKGAAVSKILVPAADTVFTTWAAQALAAKPDMIFVAWAGTTAPAMWQALDQQGVLASTTVVTGLDIRASWPTFGAAGAKISFLVHYFDGASSNAAVDALHSSLGGKPIDLFHGDGFTAAQMIVHALEADGADVDKMVKALEGWSFDGIKGKYTVRPEDHALLQPMFQTKLVADGAGGFKAQLVKAVAPEAVAPPVNPFK